MSSRVVVSCVVALCVHFADGMVSGQRCDGGDDQSWIFVNGTLSTAENPGLCLTAVTPPSPFYTLAMLPCGSSQQWQAFSLLPNNTIVLTAIPAQCINLAAYGTTPGTQVWLADCTTGGCKGNCDWEPGAHSSWTNSESKLLIASRVPLHLVLQCLDDGLEPPLPHTCAPGSPSANRTFCNISLPFDARVADFVSWLQWLTGLAGGIILPPTSPPTAFLPTILDQVGGLNVSAKIALWGSLNPPLPYDASANIKSFRWDQTCIHSIGTGPNPALSSTVFPHALSLGSTWDVDLVAAVGAVTALEGRVYNQIDYRLTGGQTFQAVSCDGGPLANTVHDGRWGRISETYGEDPVHVSAIGVAHMLALQNRSAPTPNGDYFVQLSQVTRHWLGFHGANDLPGGGVETISPLWLYDQQVPVYRSFQSDGGAEGIMCSMNSMNGLPSCVNPLLFNLLRNDFNSSAFVQTDCCDSLSTMVDELHFYATMEDAVVASMGAGVHGLFTSDPARGKAALATAVADGNVDPRMLDAAVSRLVLNRFRLGEFDTENPANPFRGPYNESDLDSPAHRSLARAVMAASAVLLHNAGGLLPLTPARLKGRTLAVIGPFADCTFAGGDDGGDAPDASSCTYLHSYNGGASSVSTILSAAAEEAAAAGATLTNATGSGITEALAPAELAHAVDLAAAADFTILVVGTGQLIEEEGLDRTTLLLPPPQAALLAAISAAATPPRLIIAVVSAGGVDFGPPVASLAGAYVVAGYGGEETGHGLWDVLTGRVSPSGRLPITHYTETYLSTVAPIADFNLVSAVTGVGRTYRFVNASSVAFHFGAGLSYSAFNYSGLDVQLAADGALTGSVSVANVGGVDAHEVVQIYLSVPPLPETVPTPAYALKAFRRIWLPASGSATKVPFVVSAAELQTTLADGSRSTTPGTYTVWASGHLPKDPVGGAQSNVVSAEFVVAAPTAPV